MSFCFQALSLLILIGSADVFAQSYNSQTKLSDVLKSLQVPMPKHYVKVDAKLAAKGKDIVFNVIATNENGASLTIQSAAFKCIDCHNVVKEDPDLRFNDPDARLSYAQENKIPLLPGTTMYGTVNKSMWFGGDYEKKYGAALIAPAKYDLDGAIQLCSRECSKGRALSDYELKAMTHYLWSLEYKLSDLNLSSNELAQLNNKNISNKSKVSLIESKYLKDLDVTFSKAPSDFEIGYGYQGDANRGKIVFEQSCLHCHDTTSQIPGIKKFPTNKLLTFKYLNRMKNSYEIIRHGKFDDPNIYMPNYSLERLSDRALDDLKAYFDLKIQELSNN